MHPPGLAHHAVRMTANRILLVEDDARLATMVAEYLGEAGFRTTRG